MNVQTPIAENPRAVEGDNFRNALDAEIAEALSEFQKPIDDRLGQAGRAVVTNDDEAGRAAALVGVLGDLWKDVDAKREEIKRPYLEGQRKIDGTFGGVKDKLTTAKNAVLAKIDAYRKEKQRIADQARIAAEAEARRKAEEAQKAAAEGDVLAAAKLEVQATKAQDAAQQQAAPVAFSSGYGQTASARAIWLHRIVDRKKLPKTVTEHPKVIEAIDTVIKAMIRGGTRELAGVEIYQDSKTVVR